MTTYNCIIDDEMLYKPHEERVNAYSGPNLPVIPD